MSYKKIYKNLSGRVFRPTIYWIDNEASSLLKYFNNTEEV